MEEIEHLKRLGFTEYEARIYFSLAKLGPSTVKSLVQDTKIPRNKIYESLYNLEQKDKVVTFPGPPKKFNIVNEDMLKNEVKELQRFTESLTNLIKEPKGPHNDLVWIIKGRSSIQKRLAENTKYVEKEIIGCNKFTSLLYQNVKSFREASRRGVKIRIISTYEEKNRENYRANMQAGVQIRIFDEEKFGMRLPRINVTDRSTASITIGEPEIKNYEDYIMIWTESSILATILQDYLERLWSECEPIEKYF